MQIYNWKTQPMIIVNDSMHLYEVEKKICSDKHISVNVLNLHRIDLAKK
jgi:hypothetical protein